MSTYENFPTNNPTLMSDRSWVQALAGLVWAVVVLALGKPFTHTCYSGKPPACGPPADPGDVFVQSWEYLLQVEQDYKPHIYMYLAAR